MNFLTYTTSYLEEILRLEKLCFPVDWQYPDAKKHYTEMLNNNQNLNIFLLEKERVVGYLIARPYKDVIEELKKYDPEMKIEQHSFYYVESIQIDPNYQGKGGSKIILAAMNSELVRKNIDYFALHARIVNHFNEGVKKIFQNLLVSVRSIEHWYFGGDEPYEYIECKVK